MQERHRLRAKYYELSTGNVAILDGCAWPCIKGGGLILRRSGGDPPQTTAFKTTLTVQIGGTVSAQHTVMTNTNTAVFAVYDEKTKLLEAVKTLKRSGFNRRDILVVRGQSRQRSDYRLQHCTRVIQGLTIGVVGGAMVGAILGLMVDKLPLFIPDSVNRTLLLVFFTMLGTLLGGASGALVGIGTPEHFSRRYARYLSQGNALVVVHVNSPFEVSRAWKILDRVGGAEIVTHSEQETLAEISRLQDVLPNAWHSYVNDTLASL